MTRRWLALLLPLMAGGCGYNTIQQLDEQANAAQGQIEVQLQRRAELIPNLVATVKGMANQELAVFSEVARARGGLLNAVQTKDPEQMAQANATMNGALGRLLAVSEAYPQLKSDQGFLRLQDELSGTANRIAVSQTDYNTSVREYNAYIRQFPAVLTAKMTGAKEKKYFQVTNPENRETPTVDFGTPGSPATAPPAGAGASVPAPGSQTPPAASGATPAPARP
ncbi:MAG TPA: LemA family protein [Gemmatimonadaceae bacterium]|nr:LemA family protein [Gemmatimonadaceae bacterium]